jgi:hypothetical protein
MSLAAARDAGRAPAPAREGEKSLLPPEQVAVVIAARGDLEPGAYYAAPFLMGRARASIRVFSGTRSTARSRVKRGSITARRALGTDGIDT